MDLIQISVVFHLYSYHTFYITSRHLHQCDFQLYHKLVVYILKNYEFYNLNNCMVIQEDILILVDTLAFPDKLILVDTLIVVDTLILVDTLVMVDTLILVDTLVMVDKVKHIMVGNLIKEDTHNPIVVEVDTLKVDIVTLLFSFYLDTLDLDIQVACLVNKDLVVLDNLDMVVANMDLDNSLLLN